MEKNNNIKQKQVDDYMKNLFEKAFNDLYNKGSVFIRIRLLLSTILKNIGDVPDLEKIKELNKNINWEKVNNLLQLPIISKYDYNILPKIDINDIQYLINIANNIDAASVDCGMWQKHVCVDCGEDFYLTKSEVDFFQAHEFDIPKRCHQCRLKRKNNIKK